MLNANFTTGRSTRWDRQQRTLAPATLYGGDQPRRTPNLPASELHEMRLPADFRSICFRRLRNLQILGHRNRPLYRKNAQTVVGLGVKYNHRTLRGPVLFTGPLRASAGSLKHPVPQAEQRIFEFVGNA